jgi:hypothetical protein
MTGRIAEDEGMTSPLEDALGSALGGLVDPRELVAKNSPDASALHVNQPIALKPVKRKKKIAKGGAGLAPVDDPSALTTKQAKQRKKVAEAGLAGNAIATVGGGHALYMAAKNPALRTSKYGKAAMAAGAGWVGLHSAELGADLIANTSLRRERRQMAARIAQKKAKAPKPPKAPTAEVKKAFSEVAQAYREGKISRAQFDEISKFSNDIIYGANALRGLAMNKTAREMTASGGRALKRRAMARAPSTKRKEKAILAQSQATWEKERPGLERRAMIGSGLALAGVSGYAGHRYGKKRGKREAAAIQKDLGWVGTISKIDEEKKQVFGWASLSTVDGEPVVDRQMDFIPIEETEKSAYTYVQESRKGGDMHKRVKKGLSTNWDEPLHTSDLIESMVFTKEKIVKMGLPEDALPEGWWVGFQIHDEKQWEDVKARRRTGFSIHGAGRRREIAA